jgi:hypothetical protein
MKNKLSKQAIPSAPGYSRQIVYLTVNEYDDWLIHRNPKPSNKVPGILSILRDLASKLNSFVEIFVSMIAI